MNAIEDALQREILTQKIEQAFNASMPYDSIVRTGKISQIQQNNVAWQAYTAILRQDMPQRIFDFELLTEECPIWEQIFDCEILRIR